MEVDSKLRLFKYFAHTFKHENEKNSLHLDELPRLYEHCISRLDSKGWVRVVMLFQASQCSCGIL